MAMLKLLLGVEKARPTCCRFVCLGGFRGLFLGSLSVSRWFFLGLFCGCVCLGSFVSYFLGVLSVSRV
jgi:hypothetical protein